VKNDNKKVSEYSCDAIKKTPVGKVLAYIQNYGSELLRTHQRKFGHEFLLGFSIAWLLLSLKERDISGPAV
jgi:hypothetical protein